jgi:hypothetical protein
MHALTQEPPAESGEVLPLQRNVWPGLPQPSPLPEFRLFGIGSSYALYPYDDCYDLVRVRTVMVGDGVASTFAAEARRFGGSVT